MRILNYILAGLAIRFIWALARFTLFLAVGVVIFVARLLKAAFGAVRQPSKPVGT